MQRIINVNNNPKPSNRNVRPSPIAGTQSKCHSNTSPCITASPGIASRASAVSVTAPATQADPNRPKVPAQDASNAPAKGIRTIGSK